MFLDEFAGIEGVTPETAAAWLLSGAPVMLAADAEALAQWRKNRTAPLLNRHELADAFGVTPPTIDAWISDGCPMRERGKQGVPHQFDLAEVRAWRKAAQAAAEEAERARRDLIGQAQGGLFGDDVNNGSSPSLTLEDVKKLREVELLTMRLNREKGLVVPAEEVTADYFAVFGYFSRSMVNLETWSVRAAGASPEFAAALGKETRRILSEAAGLIKNPDFRPNECRDECRDDRAGN